jgi:uncharacterized paraquat-inducible protein A
MGYSNRHAARCPECLRDIAVEEIQLTPKFPCPGCKIDLRVRDWYRKGQQIIAFAVALSVSLYLAFTRGILLAVLAHFPVFGAVVFLLAYAGKYFWIPPIELAPKPPSATVLGLE